MTIALRKKLIEVALPLEAINAASAREKSLRHGHPSTLHLWWARRPLAAARAVIFAQMVDDPSSWPELFPTPEAQEIERQRLFRLIEQLVRWENTTNERVLNQAREEIRKSWQRTCADNKADPRVAELFNSNKLPGFYDPFAGGGTLPLEAQRLGLESYASDLNPVSVLINKAMLEIPSKFTGQPPVNPESLNYQLGTKTWRGAQGLADDVRYYGRWMRDEAEKNIGHLYPKVEITSAMAQERTDLKPLVGKKLTIIAWIWARTVKSPNPAFREVDVPLASTFMLSTKEGKEAWVEPVIENGQYRFSVHVGTPKHPEAAKVGTSAGKRAAFRCLMSGVPVAYDYIRGEGKSGRMGARLMAIVAEGERERIYLSPIQEHEQVAAEASPIWKPDCVMPSKHRNFQPPAYGMENLGDIFSSRQLVALTTFSDLVVGAQQRVRSDAERLFSPDKRSLRDGGQGATAYSEAVACILALSVDKAADYWSTICFWHNGAAHQKIVNTFGRQAIPMSWDFAEANPFSESSGHFYRFVSLIGEVFDNTASGFSPGVVSQQDAAQTRLAAGRVISTDPPYYDNIAYADLSDFFYVWLRRAAQSIYPDIFATLEVPKFEELVALVSRHGTKEKAEAFFLGGMRQAMQRLASQAHPAFPVTIYYAFKQSESDQNEGTASTGWETFLDAVIQAGFGISGTWPMRTELVGNLKKNISALASSIVLVCRPRAAGSPTATRREFVASLQRELPEALRHLQAGNIAPVDLAQASIGPGMAVFTRYAKVLDAQGNALSVREALTLINETLDTALAEQEGDFDSDTRWALAWFEQYGFSEGEYGVAETLSKAKNTSIRGLEDAGILESKRGKVRLFKPDELPSNWEPATDSRLTHWETVHHLIRVLASDGESGAAKLVGTLGTKAEAARELAYRLYTICERKKRAAEALAYNGLVQSWPEITRMAGEEQKPATTPAQTDLFNSNEE